MANQVWLITILLTWLAVSGSTAKVVVKLKSSIETEDLFDGQNDQADAPGCGYSSCPQVDPNKLNVHLVAHTHDDVGWLKTVDQYYYGTEKRYSPVGVQFILDSIIPELVMDKTKRFIYVEMSFFSKWWQEQDEQMRSIVKRLVNEGRLEFINGGWCMNDEANVNYQSTIEQMTLGLKFLNDTFGACGRPKVGWQIDPFGHTNEQASLFAQFGFDGMFFTRISYLDKRKRTDTSSLDIVWHGDEALPGQSGSIFTSISRDGYDSPAGFCFDVMCYDDNLVDNNRSYEYNIDYKGRQFIYFLRDYADSRMTNHIMIPLGGDFQYSAARQNFKNSDKLIKSIRATAPDINIFYSTPSCYQFAVHNKVMAGHDAGAPEKKMILPDKYDDFMPYDSSPTVWWSGYFASRPSVKLIERETADLLQVARFISLVNLLRVGQQQQVAANRQRGAGWAEELRDHEAKCLNPLWEVLGDLQHHDAVTGTEKQHVADDYVRRTADAWTLCSKFIGDLRRMKLVDYLRKSPKYEQLRESGKRFKLDPVYLDGTMFCPLLNISQCDAMEAEVDVKRYTLLATNATSSSNRMKRAAREVPAELETKSVLLNVYNPLARPVGQHDVRLPCNGRCDLDKVRVIHLATNESMKLIRLPLPSGIATLPFRDALTKYEILFYANIPALGYTSFVVEDTNSEEIVDEETDQPDSIIVNDDTVSSQTVRSRRMKRGNDGDDEAEFSFLALGSSSSANQDQESHHRSKRDPGLSHQGSADRVIVKFDMSSGMIVGLKRASDGSFLNITQKFGYYFPANMGEPPGAYIFRPNSSEPHLLQKPIVYKMFKRKSGALIEIHQKWADWLWQTIRVDAKKNYIEFDYVVGPIPVENRGYLGREVVTRYITNMVNNGVFMTDSNGRQLQPRHKLRSEIAEQLGGSFYPVVNTLLLKSTANATASRAGRNGAEAVAISVDRPQAGTSLNEGQMELLIHRRQLKDDNFGVGEPLNEPGEDGRGLVSRGKHRLYLKFQDQQQQQQTKDPIRKVQSRQLFKLPYGSRTNMTYEENFFKFRTREQSVKPNIASNQPNYMVYDPVINDLKQESRRHALKPILTFDRLRVSASDFMDMIAAEGNPKIKTDLTLLNMTMPVNIHLLTLQPRATPNEVLVRLENMDNPMILHPYPDIESYQSLVQAYRIGSEYLEVNGTPDDRCNDKLRPRVELDIEYLLKRVRIVDLQELSLGANQLLSEEKRLDWIGERKEAVNCDSGLKPTLIKLAPRQIRTFIARFEYL